ncbi:Cell division protein FtsL [Mycolicibacterium vanbaalenii]|uniref:Cell division protein FtsL n=1 Tax=Mycolicibacterium vanbaalenii TaxID=110539 RepID=A0A5S9R6Z5_MYCVN|nr:septum formation initiator family protein [Mycolicibacterium vanbaalenii]CAA0132256.1 Cell division protein FtsL [Mycolicibacterium vanbaalenii]
MPEAKRPDPRRRSSGDARSKKAPASRPGKSGDGGRAKPRASASPRRDVRGSEARPGKQVAEVTEAPDSVATGESIRESIAAAAERASEQRFGSAARRAAILAAVVCVLTLTIAGPVRTYFAQRTEMKQLQASEAQLREQIAALEEQKAKLADPVFIAAQARERLGFVMPGEIPYQVQLPPGAAQPGAPSDELAEVNSGDPWYTALWGTIADAPQGIPPTAPPAPPGAPGAPEPVAPSAPPPGG